MQLNGNQNSFRTLEIQPISSVYELDTRLALSNEVRVYRTDI